MPVLFDCKFCKDHVNDKQTMSGENAIYRFFRSRASIFQVNSSVWSVFEFF